MLPCERGRFVSSERGCKTRSVIPGVCAFICRCGVIKRTKMEISHRCCFLLLMLSAMVSSQDPIELTAVRLYTEGGLLFGGAVEVRTPNGWERVCYDGFNSQMADVVCLKRGFVEGAMALRSSASLGIAVAPLPSLACEFTTSEGEDVVQCEYASTCSDHAVVICNYPGYLGCYSHTRTSPSLGGVSFARPNMTVQLCLSLCRQRGSYHRYAGVAFGQECYCEQEQGPAAMGGLAARRLGNEACFLPCVGDPLQVCGGGTAVGIYDSRLGSCHSVYADAEGAIATPGFPGWYPGGDECAWTIRVARAANVTVRLRSVTLARGDWLSVASPRAAELVTLTGGAVPSSIGFQSASHTLDARLEFTFTGGAVTVTFNSSLTSPGAQGVVITFSSSIGPPVDPSMQINMTTGLPPPSTTVTSRTVPQTPTVGPTITSPAPTTSAILPATSSPSPTVSAATAPNAPTVEGALPTTPRSVTVVDAGGPGEAPSVAVIIAIAVGIVVILLLSLTVAFLLTTSRRRGRKGNTRHDHNGHVNAAYAMSKGNDGQADSGIYDPGYANAEPEEPIYLSIRSDPRANTRSSVYALGGAGPDAEPDACRTASIRTAETDHDYQRVSGGLSRSDTECSYLSLYADSCSSAIAEAATPTSDAHCDVAEDGYMVPTPKNSTQIQLTKL